jgi:cytochrome c553
MNASTSRRLSASVIFPLLSACTMALISAYARADTRVGEALALNGAGAIPACASCHGTTGEGSATAGFPRLAGQGEAYLVKQLQDYAKQQRSNATMQPIAARLSAQQILDVATYYASLPGWHPSALKQAISASSSAQPETQQTAGYTLAQRGNWNNGVPACFACHGTLGSGVAPHFPAIAGQPAGYTRTQMDAWQRGQRNNDPQGLMQSVARKMSETEIAAVSAYFENPTIPGAPQ